MKRPRYRFSIPKRPRLSLAIQVVLGLVLGLVVGICVGEQGGGADRRLHRRDHRGARAVFHYTLDNAYRKDAVITGMQL